MNISRVLQEAMPLLTKGFSTTILITLVSLLIALVLGLLSCLMGISKIKPLNWINKFYIWIIRGTPILVQTFFIYFGLPQAMQQLGADFRLTPFSAGVITLSLNAGAYISEIFRGGIQAVNKGQMEAALMSALTPAQAIRLIILPQVVYVALPNFGNMLIALIQESSLAYLIGVVDVMGQAKIIDNMSYGAHIIEIYFAVSLLYWLLSLVTGKCVDLLSGKMGKVLG